MTGRLLKVPEVADRLGCSVDYAYRLCERGEIAVTRVGRNVRVSEESLDDYIRRQTAKPRSSRKGAAA
jgi:excisionase family DNA binding protein